MFIAFNMVGGKFHEADEWEQRTADNLAWLQENFAPFGDTERDMHLDP